MLYGKKILLGITGSIAAYKSATLVRLLTKVGAEVKVVMTPAAKDFITPLTLATLSKKPVVSDFTEDEESGVWNNHVELGLWADLMLVAPASANTLAKMAHGECDNLLMAVYLSAKCPVIVAPAMDLDMYKHDTTKGNLQKLESFGNTIIPAQAGELASGLHGEGRMTEPEEIVVFLEKHFAKNQPLSGKTVLITAGPTYEAIDPVRFIGNHSSGKMGFALAEEAAQLGACVKLVSGPVSLKAENPLIERIDITSAKEMHAKCSEIFSKSDITVMAAAVADYTPEITSAKKIKKENAKPEITLKPTKDILAELGRLKRENQILIGFALETDNELSNANEKLHKKNLDLIILNSLKDAGAGFGHDTNKITVIDKKNNIESFELKGKREVAKDIFAKILKLI
ncbi:MAG: bifunctional phosphopantothenoylcysteine decarboxylase/phosphopantothenate--cysteine ligase CoaBC [Flavobacteriales bacterium]|nr:MAG: bifunctional phosphopantothenoylcysteine decarboxylase/phosphopantothenate--cysteine ligase CoaBC [Flavobacteriales bacterium]